MHALTIVGRLQTCGPPAIRASLASLVLLLFETYSMCTNKLYIEHREKTTQPKSLLCIQAMEKLNAPAQQALTSKNQQFNEKDKGKQCTSKGNATPITVKQVSNQHLC
jgi:hypothetical protein